MSEEVYYGILEAILLEVNRNTFFLVEINPAKDMISLAKNLQHGNILADKL